tara:strand:- start:5489 stop:5980 length:492 start_codon:yes stop_codon:yes gene_type:complete
MTKRQKVIAGSIAIISIIAAVGYTQLVKAMDYVLTFKKVVVDKLTLKLVTFNLYFDLENKSTLKYRIASINTSIYVNGVFISKVVNTSEQVVEPKSTSPVAVIVILKPEQITEKLEKSWASLLMFPEKINIKMVFKLRIKYGVFAFNIPYTHTMTLKDLRKNG